MDLSTINKKTIVELSVSANTMDFTNAVYTMSTQQLKNVIVDFNRRNKELKDVFFSVKFNAKRNMLTYKIRNIVVTKYYNKHWLMTECIFGTLRQILEYDKRNNVIKKINIKPNGYKTITNFKYDEDGKLLMCINKHGRLIKCVNDGVDVFDSDDNKIMHMSKITTNNKGN